MSTSENTAPATSSRRLGSVGVLLHPESDATAALETLGRWAHDCGISAVVAAPPGTRVPAGVARGPLDALAERDLLVAIGGDGTVLRAMRLGASRGTPVLPVHLGRLGYFADIASSELGGVLEALRQGRYAVEEHPAIAIETESGQPTFALNEVALRRASGGRPARIALHIAGELFVRHSCDGLVVATPTGSTAYSFSAGGPIVSPMLAAMIVTPLAAHAVASRPLVLSAKEPVRVDVLPSSVPLAVEIDGDDHGRVGPGSHLRIHTSAVSGRLIRLGRIGRTGFAARTRSKLRISDSPELAAAGGGLVPLSW